MHNDETDAKEAIRVIEVTQPGVDTEAIVVNFLIN